MRDVKREVRAGRSAWEEKPLEAREPPTKPAMARKPSNQITHARKGFGDARGNGFRDARKGMGAGIRDTRSQRRALRRQRH